MTPTNDPAPELVARLRDEWRAASLATGWSFPDDWESPGVPDMARALVAGLDTAPAAHTLGMQRAELGVALREGLSDLAALFRIGAHTDPPFEVAGSFAEGWADATMGALLGRSATDPLTGFGTVDYLTHRLRELMPPSSGESGEPSREWPLEKSPQAHANVGPSEHDPDRTGIPYRLLLVRPADEAGWNRVVQRSAIARIMDDVLTTGETRAALPSGALVGVVAATHADEHAARLRHRLTRLAEAGYVSIEVRPMPAPNDLAEFARPAV